MSNFIEFERTNFNDELEKIVINMDKVNLIHRYPERNAIKIVFDNDSFHEIEFLSTDEYRRVVVKICGLVET